MQKDEKVFSSVSQFQCPPRRTFIKKGNKEINVCCCFHQRQRLQKRKTFLLGLKRFQLQTRADTLALRSQECSSQPLWEAEAAEQMFSTGSPSCFPVWFSFKASVGSERSFKTSREETPTGARTAAMPPKHRHVIVLPSSVLLRVQLLASACKPSTKLLIKTGLGEPAEAARAGSARCCCPERTGGVGARRGRWDTCFTWMRHEDIFR